MNSFLNEKYNWYVVYVKTGAEKAACDYFRTALQNYSCEPFYPRIERALRIKGKLCIQLQIMFKSYVFIQTDLKADDFQKVFYRETHEKSFHYQLLGKNSLGDTKVTEAEKRQIISLCDNECIVKKSIGFIVGDKIKIIEGAMCGMESYIRKIDRHKMCADILLPLLGSDRLIRVPLEIVNKI